MVKVVLIVYRVIYLNDPTFLDRRVRVNNTHSNQSASLRGAVLPGSIPFAFSRITSW